MKNTVASLLKMKEDGQKISMLTCYDYSTAKLMEESAPLGAVCQHAGAAHLAYLN